jgi:hypothetical protein
MALTVFHAIVNRYESAKTAAFEDSLPEGFDVHCFHTERDCATCQKHINGTDGYPPISQPPSIMVLVPEYNVPDHDINFVNADGEDDVQHVVGWTVPEHYEMISNLTDYNQFLELKQQFEANIEASNSGTYVANVNPHSIY